MASISSVGIGSGVLTSDLIDQLKEAERAPTEARLDAREESITTELSIFGQIQSAVTDLRLPARSLGSPDLFTALNAESSSSAISGEVTDSNEAAEGTYFLEVTSLATSNSLSTATLGDADATQLGEGTLAITIAGNTENITIDSSNNTLNGIAAEINDNANLAVTATVINVGGGFKLVLSSDETGTANNIDIAVTDTDGNNTDATGLSQLSYTTGAQNLTENQAASDASFSVNGIAVTRSSNTVDDLIAGVTLTLNSTNVGSSATLRLERDTATAAEKVQEFVDAYNALQSLISENTEFNPDLPAASGILLGDSSTRTILNSIQGVLGQSIAGLESASVRSISELGIATDAFTGQLTFNSSTFESVLSSNSFDVVGVFADQGRTTDSQIEFVSSGLNTAVGTYDVNVTQLATKAQLVGNVALGATTVIDSDNDEFSITVDGTASGTINLTAGTYTSSELAAELQTQINADASLLSAGRTVGVTVDGSGQLVISATGDFGSGSSLRINSLDTNTAAQLGFRQDLTANQDLSAGVTIDDDNNNFTISVDGTLSDEITLTSGTYASANDIAAEIQAQINADSNLTTAGRSVTVSVDASNRLQIFSNDGTTSGSVSVQSIDTNTLNDLGIFTGAGSEGLNVAGTINGVTATGNGQELVGAADSTSNEATDADGIRIRVTGGDLGARGSVSYIEGIGDQLVDLISGFLESDGTISAKNDRLNAELAEIADERIELEERITTLNDRLVRQFTAADILIAQLNSTQDFISAQLDALAGNNDDN